MCYRVQSCTLIWCLDEHALPSRPLMTAHNFCFFWASFNWVGLLHTPTFIQRPVRIHIAGNGEHRQYRLRIAPPRDTASLLVVSRMIPNRNLQNQYWYGTSRAKAVHYQSVSRDHGSGRSGVHNFILPRSRRPALTERTRSIRSLVCGPSRRLTTVKLKKSLLWYNLHEQLLLLLLEHSGVCALQHLPIV